MKVFKFGGASVKNADAVKNLSKILKRQEGENIMVVISAMGKTTNMLEELADAFFYQKNNVEESLQTIRDFHYGIMDGLFPDRSHKAFDEINNIFVELEWATEDEPIKEFDFEYDQIVSMGELLSTKIVSFYLQEAGIDNRWMDARDFIKTDNHYRHANVNWELTERLIAKNVRPYFEGDGGKIAITQGFIGVTSENFNTTLGREGSDFSAAILAYALPAEEVVIWKDVAGVLNADPKFFEDTQLIEQISYHDAIELAYYGTSVIHPKTIKPLQNKGIPLYVRSFVEPEMKGTLINDRQDPLQIPSYIVKHKQVLISIMPKDYSFIVEHNLRDIFRLLADMRVSINVMQNTAISFSLSVDEDERKTPALIDALKKDYNVLYNKNLELVTIRHYDVDTIERLTAGKKVLLELKSRNTVQMVVSD